MGGKCKPHQYIYVGMSGQSAVYRCAACGHVRRGKSVVALKTQYCGVCGAKMYHFGGQAKCLRVARHAEILRRERKVTQKMRDTARDNLKKKK